MDLDVLMLHIPTLLCRAIVCIHGVYPANTSAGGAVLLGIDWDSHSTPSRPSTSSSFLFLFIWEFWRGRARLRSL